MVGFKPGTAHMKNKFCDQCRAGFTIPAERVRALLPEDKDRFDNASASGVWKRSIGVAARYRLINQTLHCRGPKLLIFEGPAPEDHAWGELPPTWVWPGGLVRLRTAYGTLVPIETNNFRSRKRWHEDSASAASRGGQVVQHIAAYPSTAPQQISPNALQLCNAGYMPAGAMSWQQAMGHHGVAHSYGEVPAVLVAPHGVTYPGQAVTYPSQACSPPVMGGQPQAQVNVSNAELQPARGIQMNGMAPSVMPPPAAAPVMIQATPESMTVAPTAEAAVHSASLLPAEPAEPTEPTEPAAAGPAAGPDGAVVNIDSASDYYACDHYVSPEVQPSPQVMKKESQPDAAPEPDATLDAEADSAAFATGLIALAHAEVADAACVLDGDSPTSGQPARDRLLALRTLLTEGLVSETEYEETRHRIIANL